ncbi:hypothetical protein DCC39_08905 [Pueribacillus theae]|uniref:Uncharacterized protein n=1 Tax=Pueribacillus theae TaxID=2171751 RepID=A0A2U1K3S0_9BACI|nr:hypothetical protein DCC39_08905 [Pueribacillus theae]
MINRKAEAARSALKRKCSSEEGVVFTPAEEEILSRSKPQKLDNRKAEAARSAPKRKVLANYVFPCYNVFL